MSAVLGNLFLTRTCNAGEDDIAGVLERELRRGRGGVRPGLPRRDGGGLGRRQRLLDGHELQQDRGVADRRRGEEGAHLERPHQTEQVL